LISNHYATSFARHSNCSCNLAEDNQLHRNCDPSAEPERSRVVRNKEISITTYNDIRAALQGKREELRQWLTKIQHNLRSTPAPDSQEQASERENDEVLEHLDDSSRAELEMIEAALARITAGTYATCVRCGGSISAERLAALPYTTTCITCAR
jgi:DnaK suppressor protein